MSRRLTDLDEDFWDLGWNSGAKKQEDWSYDADRPPRYWVIAQPGRAGNNNLLYPDHDDDDITWINKEANKTLTPQQVPWTRPWQKYKRA